MKLTYIKQAGEPNGDAGDQYTGLDRFGRVVDQRWPQGSSELERVDYGFTPASNRQWRQNRVAAGGQDEYYNYDGLYQVSELNRGTLNSGKTGIAGTPSWTEDFTYDPIGNWDAYLTKVAGTTNLDQTRTHNTANETVEIGGSTATVSSDLAGNMTKVPQVADWEATNELKWDAWNRLVEVVDGETVVAQYRYDGKTRRVSKEVDAVRHYYYSDQWQIIEERVDEETTAERQFVWGQRYLDDLVLRDRDVDADGSMDERLYVLSDYFNPTAIADEDGNVLERYGYNAFGLSRVMDADFDPRSSSDFDWETRFGAYRWDGETGFYQVRYRYLHPTLGRWVSRDPLQEVGARNLLCYASNNCINMTDPYGERVKCETAKNRAILSGPRTKAAMRKLKDNNCRTPSITCGCCTQSENGPNARFLLETNSIELCQDKIESDAGIFLADIDIDITLAHELVHALQSCQGGTFSTCEERACAEVNAYCISGRCDYIPAGPIRDECVKNASAFSVAASGLCEDVKAAVNTAFDSGCCQNFTIKSK